MSVIDATAVPPAASTTVAREDGSDNSDRLRRQQQQQHGSATSVGAGGVTFDELERRGSRTPDTDAGVSIVVDGATDRTPLLTRRVTYRDEDGGTCDDRGADRVIVDGQVNLVRIYETVAI